MDIALFLQGHQNKFFPEYSLFPHFVEVQSLGLFPKLGREQTIHRSSHLTNQHNDITWAYECVSMPFNPLSLTTTWLSLHPEFRISSLSWNILIKSGFSQKKKGLVASIVCTSKGHVGPKASLLFLGPLPYKISSVSLGLHLQGLQGVIVHTTLRELSLLFLRGPCIVSKWWHLGMGVLPTLHILQSAPGKVLSQQKHPRFSLGEEV